MADTKENAAALLERSPTVRRIDGSTLCRFFRRQGEPAWLSEKRAAFLESLGSKRLPSPWEEEWRGTDLRAMGLGDLEVPLPGTIDVRLDRTGTEATLAPLLDCADSMEERIRPHLFKAYPMERAPLLYRLNSALMTGGALFFLPDGSEDPVEGRAVFDLTGRKGAVFPRNVVRVGAKGRAFFTEEYRARSGSAFCQGTTEVFVGPDAHLDLLTLVDWPGEFRSSMHAVAHVAEGARLQWYVGALGGTFARVDVELFLDGPGAESLIAGVGIGDGDTRLDLRTVQRHVSKDTKSRIHFGTLLQGSSESIYRGLIRMEPGALRCDAYQKNDNLILEAGARAQAIPMLEILADDVKCSHGSTVGRISDEDLFYLTSRGLSVEASKRLVCDGFIRRQLNGAGEGNPLTDRLHEVLARGLARLTGDA